MIHLLWLLIPIFVAAWLYLGYLGSKRMANYHAGHYKKINWTNQDELISRILMFFGPINYVSVWVSLWINFKDSDKETSKSWFYKKSKKSD